MKILIYINSLNSGGAEKVVSLMANYWAVKHHVIVLTNSPIDNDFFILDSQVDRQTTAFSTCGKNLISKIFYNFYGLIQLRYILKRNKPDIIISHLQTSNIRMLLSSIGLGIPTIVEDHNNPAFYKIQPPWNIFYPWIYVLSNKMVILTKDLQKNYSSFLHKKMIIIPNPLNLSNNISHSYEIEINHPTFITMGNFRHVKGYDLLIEAFAIVHKTLPNWNLTILGDGSGRNILEHLIKKLSLENKVHLPGRIQDTYGVLKTAEIYVLSSRSEGFPVALCEAMAVGLPCISFNCPTGPADIIQNNVNGILVEYLNIEHLAQSMIDLANNPDICKRLSSEAIKINQTLNLSVIMSQWETIIRSECKVAI